MTQQKIEVKLYDLLIKSNEPFVASISGEWGIGKTYFLQKIFLEKYKSNLSKKQIAYVSLFEQAVKNIKKALEELSSQSDDYKFKVERILKVK